MFENRIGGEFDEYYYAHDCGIPYERNEHRLNFFGAIAERIVNDFSPNTVLDAGCAKGFLVECLRNKGVDAFGIDISEYAINNVHELIKDYCKVASIADPLDSLYDVIISIEVVEHMEKSESEAAITNLCSHTDKISFLLPHDYSEVTHINVQQLEFGRKYLLEMVLDRTTMLVILLLGSVVSSRYATVG